jgi:hypothetical protein
MRGVAIGERLNIVVNGVREAEKEELIQEDPGCWERMQGRALRLSRL